MLSWESGESRLEAVFALRSRYSAVGRLLFSSQSMEVARRVRIAAYVLAGLFCGAVVISLIVAVSLTRTLTGAVHELYLGTERVNQSDFSHRVPIRGDDHELLISENWSEYGTAVWSYSYDLELRILEALFENDQGNNATIDETDRTTYTWDCPA